LRRHVSCIANNSWDLFLKKKTDRSAKIKRKYKIKDTVHVMSSNIGINSSSSSSSVANTLTTFVIIEDDIAKGMGYSIGIGSFLMYTPIAIRIFRQKHANGLVITTWWLKIIHYILSDIYSLRHHYILSTWSEALVLTIESLVVLFLVAFYQKQIYTIHPFWIMIVIFLFASNYVYTKVPIQIISFGQLSSCIIGNAALVPQFYYNYSNQSKGDYSPITCILAGVGCFIRIFTTVILNNSDLILLLTYSMSLITNLTLVIQILYYGIQIEKLTFKQVFTADIRTEHNNHNNPRTSSSSISSHIIIKDHDRIYTDDDDNDEERSDLQLVVPSQQQQQQKHYDNKQHTATAKATGDENNNDHIHTERCGLLSNNDGGLRQRDSIT
jgi:hypothetical protein